MVPNRSLEPTDYRVVFWTALIALVRRLPIDADDRLVPCPAPPPPKTAETPARLADAGRHNIRYVAAYLWLPIMTDGQLPRVPRALDGQLHARSPEPARSVRGDPAFVCMLTSQDPEPVGTSWGGHRPLDRIKAQDARARNGTHSAGRLVSKRSNADAAGRSTTAVTIYWRGRRVWHAGFFGGCTPANMRTRRGSLKTQPVCK